MPQAITKSDALIRRMLELIADRALRYPKGLCNGHVRVPQFS